MAGRDGSQAGSELDQRLGIPWRNPGVADKRPCSIWCCSHAGSRQQSRKTAFLKAVDAEDFRDFLIGIRNEYDKERKIIVVCDNASIHKAKVVKDWIAEDGNFELAFIPPYSPELNPVEVFNQVLKVKMRMAPAMTQAETQTFAQEQAQAMKQGKGAGVRKCFERDTVKYATYRESRKHLKDKE